MNLAHAVLATIVVGIGFYGLYSFAQADRKLKRIKVRISDDNRKQ